MVSAQLNLDDVKAYDGPLKYVRVGDEFRFCEFSIDGRGPYHDSLVEEGEFVVSAGVILIMKRFFKIPDDAFSTTLNIGPADDDVELLSKILDRQNR